MGMTVQKITASQLTDRVNRGEKIDVLVEVGDQVRRACGRMVRTAIRKSGSERVTIFVASRANGFCRLSTPYGEIEVFPNAKLILAGE